MPGETLLGDSLVNATGGKGANQALAAARAGARPAFIGAVGDDANGREISQFLTDRHVDTTHMIVAADQPTGVALITVDRSGENSIVVSAGANGTLDDHAVSLALAAMRPSRETVLLTQLEIPLAAAQIAAEIVSEAGGRVILNLSPSREIPQSFLAVCDPLIVNSAEAADLTGTDITTHDDAAKAIQSLSQICRSVVLTLGASGAMHSDGHRLVHTPSPEVHVVDTTGAGDAFAGMLAAALASGAALDEAVARAVHAGAEAVQWLGAQPADSE